MPQPRQVNKVPQDQVGVTVTTWLANNPAPTRITVTPDGLGTYTILIEFA
jgi:hypothetical protein